MLHLSTLILQVHKSLIDIKVNSQCKEILILKHKQPFLLKEETYRSCAMKLEVQKTHQLALECLLNLVILFLRYFLSHNFGNPTKEFNKYNNKESHHNHLKMNKLKPFLTCI